MPAHLFFAVFIGLAFIATAIAIAVGKLNHPATALLGLTIFLWDAKRDSRPPYDTALA